MPFQVLIVVFSVYVHAPGPEFLCPGPGIKLGANCRPGELSRTCSGVHASQTLYLPDNPLGLFGVGESNLPHRILMQGSPGVCSITSTPGVLGGGGSSPHWRHTSVELVQGGQNGGG